MLRRSSRTGLGICTAVVLLVSGCAGLLPPPPETFSRTITFDVPELTPLTQTAATQTRSGVSISLRIEPPQLYRNLMCQYRPHQAPVLFMPAGATKATHDLFREARFEAPGLSTRDVLFHFTITNRLDRVFRGAGAVLQLSVDGKAQPIAQNAYIDFLNTLVLPREVKEVTVRIPGSSDLIGGGALGVFLYDVVTKTNAAGNVQARENFEWYYKVKRNPVSETVSAPRRTVWVSKPDAQVIYANPDRITGCFDGVYPKDNY